MQEYFIRGTAASPFIPMASPKDLPHWKIHPVRERSFTHFRMAASVPHWMCSRRHWYSSSRLCSSGQGRFRCRGMSSRCPAGQTTGWICLSFLCFFIKSLPRFSLSAFFSKNLSYFSQNTASRGHKLLSCPPSFRTVFTNSWLFKALPPQSLVFLPFLRYTKLVKGPIAEVRPCSTNWHR